MTRNETLYGVIINSVCVYAYMLHKINIKNNVHQIRKVINCCDENQIICFYFHIGYRKIR